MKNAREVSPVAVENGESDATQSEQKNGARYNGSSVGIGVLTVLAVLYTLYVARPFLLPIVFAILLNFLFSPIVRSLEKLHVPRALGSAIVVLGLLGLLALSVYELAAPVQTWASKLPQTLSSAEEKLRHVLRPIQKVTSSAEQAEKAASAVSGIEKPPEVVVAPASAASRYFDAARILVAALLEVFILLYFLLSVGDLFLQKLIKVIPSLKDKKKAVRIARETQVSISTYLLTTMLVSVAEGVVVAVAMYALGMPNAILWGTLAAVLELVPYIGALALIALLTVAAVTTFSNHGHALLVPATFLVINVLQSNVVSPLLYGHRLALNPVAIFVGLAFWYWIWGIPGAFIAVPLLATLRICCDHIESLAPVGEFLGEKSESTGTSE
jgi:predicted PurR-regulated permease PerM